MKPQREMTRGDRALSEVSVPAGQFARAVAARVQPASQVPLQPNASQDRGRFAGLFGSAHQDGSVLLRAAVAGYGKFDVVSALVRPGRDGTFGSYEALTPSVPGAAWYEREIADLFGLVPEGHPRIDPLVLPRGEDQAPPRPGSPSSGQSAAILLDETPLPAHLAGEGVFTLPYGPVRSGVFESVQFLVETPGEDIPHLRARVYHKHRGVEVRFQGMSPADGVLLAEQAWKAWPRWLMPWLSRRPSSP